MYLIKYATLFYYPFIFALLQETFAGMVMHDLKCPVINKRYLTDVMVYLHADSKSNEFFLSLNLIRSFPQNATAHMKVLKRSFKGQYDVGTHIKHSGPLCSTVMDPSQLLSAAFHKKIFKQCPAPAGKYELARIALLDPTHQKYFTEALEPQNYLITMHLTHETEVIYYCSVHLDIN